MILDGQFGVDDAKWTDAQVRAKLEALSRTAEGHPKDEDAGSAVSDLRGKFHLEKGTIDLSELAFSVPGAAIELKGNYAVRGGNIDLRGRLRTKATVSQMTTGAKSFVLKAFDPFFKKNGAGADLPIQISGERDHVTFGVMMFHKTLKKSIPKDQEEPAGRKNPENAEKKSPN